MRLDMKMKKKLSEETAKRYCTANKKHKTKIIDEFVANTGYYRFEGEQARSVMAELYEHYNKLVNFFFPSMKIISKQRVDAKLIKKYDTAKTPYRRLIESADVTATEKQQLRQRKNNLDFAVLLEKTQQLQGKLISMVLPWTT